MKDIINIKESSNNSTSNKDINTNSVISVTVHSEEVYNGETENTCGFKVNEDGKIIVNCENHIKGVNTPIKDIIEKEESKSKVRITSERLLDMIENLPEGLSEIETGKIIEFLNIDEINEINETSSGRMFPYSVKLMDNDDVMVTLVVYNGGQFPLSLSQIPLKLIDGNKSVIIADLIDINVVVNIGKIGVFEIIVSKEKLKKDTINLDEWCITFSM